MKSLLKFLSIALFALLFFTSCQDEIFEETPINEEEVLVANSALASSMRSTATMDGSLDNIIDHANCLSIELPVTVIVNGLEITIDSVEDYEVIEAIFDEFDNDNDNLEIVFPITIILSDFTEITINNYDELENFIDECSGENEVDDDIECIDFQYPITISIFNSEFQVIDTVTINSDDELYNFIENELEDNVLASLNYPVTMILSDGSTITVNSNAELEAAIDAAENECDEDDDNDYGDDDEVISPNQFMEILTSCTWTVDKLELGDQNQEEQYIGYVFTFNMDGTLSVESNGTILTGTWDKIVTDNGIQINLQINDLPDFNNEHWILHEVEEHEGELEIDFRNGEDRLRFESFECEGNNNPTDCSELAVDEILMECHWEVAAISGGVDFNDYDFYFNDGQQLVIEGNDVSVSGNWMTSMSDSGVVITISELTEPLHVFNGEWLVIDCNGERLVLTNGEIELVIEKDCETSCTELDVDGYLLECVWNVVNFNGDDHLINYDLDFIGEQGIIITDTVTTDTFEGFWSTSQTNDGVLIQLANISGPNIQAISGNWIVIDCANDRLKLENDLGDFFIIEQNCN